MPVITAPQTIRDNRLDFEAHWSDYALALTVEDNIAPNHNATALSALGPVGRGGADPQR